MAVTARHRTPSAPPPSLLARLGSLLLTTAAVLGLGCIVLVILGLTANMTLVMFSTGSMAPTIPGGSVALVQEIDGDAIEVGDVVTVEREGQLPVTHRVIEVVEVDGITATFRMQGDANSDPDGEAYVADRVRIVRGHVPGIARAVAQLQNPLALGALTVGATVLVTWAFWPRRDEERLPREV